LVIATRQRSGTALVFAAADGQPAGALATCEASRGRAAGRPPAGTARHWPAVGTAIALVCHLWLADTRRWPARARGRQARWSDPQGHVAGDRLCRSGKHTRASRELSNGKRAALTRARQRRVELDRDRAQRDRRVEASAAQVFVLVEQRNRAQQVVQDLDVALGAALRELQQEGLTVPDVACLCELRDHDVRRLSRLPAPVAEPQEALPHPVPPTGDDAAVGSPSA